VKHILVRDISVYYSNHYQSYIIYYSILSNILFEYHYQSYIIFAQSYQIFYLNKIDNGLRNKPKRLLLIYVSHNFDSAILD